ncbi:thioredoxin family protein [Nocardia sp. NEAU-G5]|uniref:Thioredoxin family protein n=1 Tax=Nocardia albiluteola TaxID=2842303 RepID=A0ABS6AT65_9NOCA|nr:thioredoxin family protein [Nocardia albiluteola]MBU3061218.1 thioredoxin family protein [Nocardia albiluteola]
MTQILILVAVLAAAAVVGVLVRRREGRVRTTGADTASASGDAARTALLAAVGVGADAPAVLHFSAEWCGPCEAVRRVVQGVVTDLAQAQTPPLDIEIDIDAEPTLARELNVLSLPTTFVFDARGRERFRISGVPKSSDLRSAVAPLTLQDAA